MQYVLGKTASVPFKMKYTPTTRYMNIPGYLPRHQKQVYTKKSDTIIVLFIIAQSLKQPRGPAMDQWRNCGIAQQWDIGQYQKEMSYRDMAKHKFYINIFQNIILIDFFGNFTTYTLSSQSFHAFCIPCGHLYSQKKKLKRRVQCVLLLYLLEQRQAPSGSPWRKLNPPYSCQKPSVG